MQARLFHIAPAEDVPAATGRSEYVPAAFATDGFVHCSHVGQVVRVANARFRGRTDLALLEIDPDRLPCRVVEENLEGGDELFPHIYGPVPAVAVVATHSFPCGESGEFDLPPGLGANTEPPAWPQPPILMIRPGSAFWFAPELRRPERCTLQSFEEGVFRDAVAIDSRGRSWPVTAASLAGAPSFLDRVLPWRRVAVTLELGAPEIVAVDEVSRMLREIVGAEAFEAPDPRRVELDRQFRAARSVDQLVEVARLASLPG